MRSIVNAVKTQRTSTPQIGVRDQFAGVFYWHWEWLRFEIRVPRRYFGSRLVRCDLEPDDGVGWFLGLNPPPDRDGYRRFHVVIDGTPIEKGHYGHRGMLTYRIVVHDWLSVAEI